MFSDGTETVLCCKHFPPWCARKRGFAFRVRSMAARDGMSCLMDGGAITSQASKGDSMQSTAERDTECMNLGIAAKPPEAWLYQRSMGTLSMEIDDLVV